MAKKNFVEKNVNKAAKNAKKHPGAAAVIAAGAALSVLGNITIGTMTVVKAIKNKKAAKAVDPEPAPAPTAGDNSNTPEGGNQDNQNPNPDPENK